MPSGATVAHSIFIEGQGINIIVVSYLIYKNDDPHILIVFPDGHPDEVVRVDSSRLHRTPGGLGEYMYESPIELPVSAVEKVRLIMGQPPQT